MTLKEMKQRVLSLIEEINPSSDYLTDDEDIQHKINSVIDQVQNELCRYKKIPAKYKYTITSETGNTLDTKTIPNFYQLKFIDGTTYTMRLNIIIFNEEYTGDVDIYYYKYPVSITPIISLDGNTDLSTTYKALDSSYIFELSQDLLNIMPYGVAADLLKNDMISGYGQYYANRYNELKQMIDPRDVNAGVVIEGGEDV